MSIFDKYLITGEKIIGHTGESEVNFAVTNKRILSIDADESNFQDIRLGNIVSLGWDYTSNVQFIGYFILLIIVGFVFLFMSPEELRWLSILFFLIGVGFLIAYFLTRKCFLTVITTGGYETKIGLGGKEAKDDIIHMVEVIRNADEEYTPKG